MKQSKKKCSNCFYCFYDKTKKGYFVRFCELIQGKPDVDVCDDWMNNPGMKGNEANRKNK